MYLDFSDYLTVPATVLSKNTSSASIKIESPVSAYVTVLVFKDGKPVAFLNTEGYIRTTILNVYHQVDTGDFSLLIIRKRDGFSNSSLGSSNFGIFFSSIRARQLLTTTGSYIPGDVAEDSSYIIQVPISSEEFELEYNPIGKSTTEIGDLHT